VPATPNPNESVAVELSDGRVMLNMRNESQRFRRLIAISPDGATHWSEPLYDEALFEPICMAGLVRAGKRPADKIPLILFSNLDSRSKPAGPDWRARETLAIKASEDDGRTWAVFRVLEPNGTGYSDLAVAADGSILCLYEDGGTTGHGSWHIHYLTSPASRWNGSTTTERMDELRPLALGGGRVLALARTCEGHLWELRSEDDGKTWTSPKPTPLVHPDAPPMLFPLVEEFAVGEHRILRKLSLVGEGPWIRVVTRLEPSRQMSLHQLSDQLRFSHRAAWSYSPSVGGFNPDAQYKAPLILVQAGRVALGLVPDLAVLGREDLKRCNHALDLDVPGGPLLRAGFLPARLASHSGWT
ncbi:MAG: exo-alpha-sialidase, partial [Planctomycetota bacterium]|nr:exo-alpha-sialidase [Planctomycetota bacterium]